jgi:hypothetical protein
MFAKIDLKTDPNNLLRADDSDLRTSVISQDAGRLAYVVRAVNRYDELTGMVQELADLSAGTPSGDAAYELLAALDK